MRRLDLSIVFALLAGLAASQAAAGELAVVVHPSRPLTLRVEEISRIYLKQQRFWQNGDPILPINHEARSATRKQFERAVFGSRPGSLADYWNREYFRGVLPPATLASDEAVRRFVASEPRAIGYLPADLVDDTVHVAARLPKSVTGQARIRWTPTRRFRPAFAAAPQFRLSVAAWEIPIGKLNHDTTATDLVFMSVAVHQSCQSRTRRRQPGTWPGGLRPRTCLPISTGHRNNRQS